VGPGSTTSTSWRSHVPLDSTKLLNAKRVAVGHVSLKAKLKAAQPLQALLAPQLKPPRAPAGGGACATSHGRSRAM
jgi:hypothetical protein